SQLRQRLPGERRSDHHGNVELDRIEGDGIRHIFFVDESRDQGLIGGTAEGLGESRNEGQAKNVPDMNMAGRDQYREEAGGRHLHILRGEQDLATLDAIGDDSAKQRKEEDGDAAEKLVGRKQKGGGAQPKKEQALAPVLNQGAD